MPSYGKPVKVNANGSGYDKQGQYMTPDEVREAGGSSKSAKSSSKSSKSSSSSRYGNKVSKLNPNGSGYDERGNYLTPDEVRERGGGKQQQAKASPARPPQPVAAPPRPAPAPVVAKPPAPAPPPVSAPLAGLTTIAPGTAEAPAQEASMSAPAPMAGGMIQEPEPPMSMGVATQALGSLRGLGRRTLPDLGAPLAALRRVY